MGIGDNLVEKAVSEAFEQSGLEPGELNNKIDGVMDTIDEASVQLDNAEDLQNDVRTDIQEMNEAAKILAEASTTLAESSMRISETAVSLDQSISNHSDRLEGLEDEMAELRKAFEGVQTLIEENTN